jgi:predicted metal-dependent phosphoesterase TrpH
MRTAFKKQHIWVVTIVAFACLSRAGAAQNPSAGLNWYRGNLHTHTISSDGDSSPWDLMAWYKRNGYQFLAITDHNTFTDPAAFDTNPNDNFLLIGAEEVTNEKTVHVNAIGISKVILPKTGPTPTDILQANIDAIRAQGAVPLINHPNFRWAFTAREMLALKGVALLEIASGHPAVNHAGDGRIPATERMWDELLSAGMKIFGVAVDDAHNFRQEFTIDRANPGRGWVVVRAPALTREHVLTALGEGNFYASSGVELKNIIATKNDLSVEIQTTTPSGSPKRYRVVFIGKDGRELATSIDNPARYTFTGSESYVRARIEDSGGLRAWTQPVFVSSQTPR